MATIEERQGRRIVVQLDELDCELIVQAIKTAQVARRTLNNVRKFLGWSLEPTPKADEREAELIKLFEGVRPS